MPLLVTSLSAELVVIAGAHPANVAAAIISWATAFDNYMAASTCNGAPLNPAVASVASLAMQGALAGLGAGGAAALAAGVTAYWAALNVPGAYGASLSVTPPPGVGGLAAALTAVFAANTSGALVVPGAQDAIAAAWHPLMLGGIAIFPPALPFPIL